MKKFGIVLGVAAAVTLAGCKDPDFQRSKGPSVDAVKNVDTTPVPQERTPAEIGQAPAARCTCAPGTRHTAPCACGAADCTCIVETKPVESPAVKAPDPVEPEYTLYTVRSGDYLAKISKRYNVTISSIRRLNPSIRKDVIRVGQKLKLPGKIDVGAQEEVRPAPAASAKKANAKAFAAYTGPTKEYVVRNGDTLGAIAYGNGINIRQLKALNGLTSDAIRVGQKLKVPAEKAAAPAAPTKAAVETKPVEAKAAVETKPVETKPVEEKPTEEKASAAVEPKADAEAATRTYVVQDTDDMTSVSIRWGVTAAQIRELNNLGENDQLVPNQVIKLPAGAQQ